MNHRHHLMTTMLGVCLALVCAFSRSAGAASVGALASATVVRVRGSEALSQPFRFEIDLASKAAIDLTPGGTLGVTLPGGRAVHGVVDTIALVGLHRLGSVYRVVLVPKLAGLEHVRRSRAWQKVKASDVINQVLQQYGITPNMPASTVVHRQVVQLEETDLEFVQRLLAAEGNVYYFEHTSTAHNLKVAKELKAPALTPGSSGLVYGTGKGATLIDFSFGQSVQSGTVTLQGFDIATAALVSESASGGAFRDNAWTGYVARSREELRSTAKAMLAAETAGAQRCQGVATTSQMVPGYAVSVGGHFLPSLNRQYLVVGADHSYDGTAYRTQFRCVSKGTAVAAPQPPPLPNRWGTFTGVVTSNEPQESTKLEVGGAVKTTQYTFPKWIRVALNTGSGKLELQGVRVVQGGAPAWWVPVVDEEVVVAFEQGDLERPLVIGTVFNNEVAKKVLERRFQVLPAGRAIGFGDSILEFYDLDRARGNESVGIRVHMNSLMLEVAGDAGMRLLRKSGTQTLTLLEVTKDGNVTISGTLKVGGKLTAGDGIQVAGEWKSTGNITTSGVVTAATLKSTGTVIASGAVLAGSVVSQGPVQGNPVIGAK
jgi:Rhs element Vgr protein